MIRVLGDRVLVLLPEPEDEITTASGLVLMRDPDRRKTPTRGIIVQLGDKQGTCDLQDVRSEVHTFFVDNIGCNRFLTRGVFADWWETIRDEVDRLLMQMQPAPFDVAVGDCVIFPLGAGEEFTDAGHDYVVLKEDEILGVLEPMTA